MYLLFDVVISLLGVFVVITGTRSSLWEMPQGDLAPSWRGSLSRLNASRPHRERRLHSFMLRAVPVTSTRRTTGLLFREVGLSYPPACLRPVFDANVYHRGEERAAAAQSETEKSSVCSSSGTCWTLRGSRSDPEWVCFADCYERWQIYVKNTALLNFWCWSLRASVYACDVGERGEEESG